MRWGGYRSKLAKKKAIMVVAHAMIVIIWHVLVTGKPYAELGDDYFDRRADPEREIARLTALLGRSGPSRSSWRKPPGLNRPQDHPRS